MISKRGVCVSVALVFCASMFFTGCERLGLTKKKAGGIGDSSLIDVNSYTNDINGDELSSGKLAPRGDAFTSGTRVADAFENVLFDFDSAQIAQSERAKIETIGTYMKDKADTVAILNGNCDERGSTEYNMSLGERRALAARAYLMNLGIDGARIQTRSFGKEKPLNPGHDEESWRVNRRVEFEILH